jgi:Protein of unknown function (DUF1275)/WD domain, G-beta repeat
MTEQVLPVEPVGRAVGATATLSFVGGFVDVVGFIALFGLFTAHVTGNFIMLGLEMVHATKLAIAKLLAVPIFIMMVALTRLFVLHYEKRGESPWREMLLAQAALLARFMIAGGLTTPHEDPNELGPVVAGLVRVWDLATAKEVIHSGEGYASICCVAISPDGKTAATGNFDNKIMLWDVASGASFGSLDHADWLQCRFFARRLDARLRQQR